MKKIAFIIIAVLVGGLILYRLVNVAVNRFSNKGQATQEKRIPVRARTVQRMDLSEKLKLTGDIVGQDVINILPQVSGKVEAILIQEGQHVSKGQVLFKINRDIVGMEYLPAPVDSPISGYVGKIFVDRGASVAPTVPMAQIVNMSSVKAVVHLIEEDMGRVKLGQAADVTVEAQPGRIFHGSISKKSAVVDPVSRTQDAHIHLSNGDMSLRHGMFATVNIILGRKNAVLAVPVDSVLTDDAGRRYVFTITNNRAMRRVVTLGISTAEFIEVMEGLHEGDAVVTMGQDSIAEGDRLLVYYDDAPPAEGSGTPKKGKGE